jgi:HK97 family phage major capsid protein
VPTADTQLRDRLKDVREKTKDARQRRASAQRERDDARSAFAGADFNGETKITETSEFKAAEQAVASLGRIDDELADLNVAETGILKMLGSDEGPSDSGGNARGGAPQDLRAAWDGHRLLASEGSTYRQSREAGVFSSSARFGTVQLGQIASRENAADFFSAALPAATPGPVTTAGVGAAIRPDYRGVMPPSLQPLTLLDLIPVGTTDSNSIEYVQVSAIPGSAAETAEGAVKPEEGLTTVDATAPVRTIAGWIKLNRQALDDTAGLATLINTLLPYDVRRRIQNQIIGGDGVGQNLRGILETTGVGAPTFVTGDNIADAILRAMTVVILSDANPNFVALNPTAWQDLMLMREDNDARTGAYLFGSPAQVAAPTIWGLSVIPSRAVAAEGPLVGDAMGCTLLVREGVNVKTSDSDQDDFVRNRVTVLAEARVAFPVWRPASFAVATTVDPGP